MTARKLSSLMSGARSSARVERVTAGLVLHELRTHNFGVLSTDAESRRRGEMRICFLKITLDPLIRTYMVGYGIWELRSRMESGAAKVVISPP